MGVYSGSSKSFGEDVEVSQETMDLIMEMFCYDDIQHLSEKDRKQLLESTDGEKVLEELEEAGLINKTAIVKLTKEGDFERRKTAVAYALAKEKNDPSWKKFIKAQRMKMEAKAEILKKYGSKSTMLAKKGQREYIKQHGVSSITIH